MRAKQGRSRQMRGMTLIELMVVMLIVGILSAIAVPSYRNYVLRVKRTDAKTGLTSAAQRLERCFTHENAYNKAACTLAVPYTLPPDATGTDTTYRLTGDIQANTFTLTATRINRQVDDTGCGEFTLNAVGKQDIVGGTKTAVECWR